MKFPNKNYNSINNFFKDYSQNLILLLQNTDFKQLDNASKLIERKIKSNNQIFVCGNGGSAAISNHFICDAFKLLKTDTKLNPRIYSLCSHSDLISAISNDISYDDVFSFQLKNIFNRGDLLVTISSSGNSKNVINAATYAKKKGGQVISITGFQGGKLKKISNVKVHCAILNYGLSEDFAHIIMHVIIQFIKQANLINKNIKTYIF